MNVLHLSDTHLGYAAYRKIDPASGLNQREIDIYNAFSEVIDYAVKSKPDLVIHAGDLFDNVRPNNRAIHEAIKQVIRLASKDIPILIVSGNHSTPRQRTTGSLFKILEYFPNVYPVYQGKYETRDFGDLKVHAVPHAQTPEMLKKGFKKLAIDKKFEYNILVTHTGVTGVKEFSMGEFNEQIIPSSVLSKKFDYIALGHYHKFIKVTENAYYSGSTERFSFNEANDKKGFLEVNLDNGNVEHIPIKTREMIDVPPINCMDLTTAKVMRAIEDKTGDAITGKIVRIPLQNISRTIYVAMDFNKIREMTSKAAHFEINYEWKKEKGVAGGYGPSIGTLGDEFKGYMAQIELRKKERAYIRKLGFEYLQKAREVEGEE